MSVPHVAGWSRNVGSTAGLYRGASERCHCAAPSQETVRRKVAALMPRAQSTGTANLSAPESSERTPDTTLHVVSLASSGSRPMADQIEVGGATCDAAQGSECPADCVVHSRRHLDQAAVDLGTGILSARLPTAVADEGVTPGSCPVETGLPSRLHPQRANEWAARQKRGQSMAAGTVLSIECSEAKRGRREPPDNAGHESNAAPAGVHSLPPPALPITEGISEATAELDFTPSRVPSSEPTDEPTPSPDMATAQLTSRRDVPAGLSDGSTHAPTLPRPALLGSTYSATSSPSRGLMLPPPVPPRKPPSGRSSLPSRPCLSFQQRNGEQGAFRRRTLSLPITRWAGGISVD